MKFYIYLTITVLTLLVLFFPKFSRAAGCGGVSKCMYQNCDFTKDPPDCNCTNQQTQGKSCSGASEDACYASELNCDCLVGGCYWGTPGPYKTPAPWTCPCGKWYDTVCKTSCPSDGGFCGYSNTGALKYSCVEDGCNTCPTCTTTAATNLRVAKAANGQSVTLKWDPPTTNITSQRLYFGNVRANVVDDCAAGSCSVYSLPATTNQRTISYLTPGDIYFWKVASVNTANGGCTAETTIHKFITSCRITAGASTIEVDEETPITTEVLASSSISLVNFAVTSAESPHAVNLTQTDGVLNVNDSTYPFSTVAVGKKAETPSYPGTSTITATVYDNVPAAICSNTVTIKVINATPWWQIRDSDLMTNGNLRSKVPTGSYFGLMGAGGFPGVPAYGGTIGGITTTKVTDATSKWIANTTATNLKTYDYAWFASQAPADVDYNDINDPNNASDSLMNNTKTSYGYRWFKYTGTDTLNIAASVLGARKIILFVENAKVNITGDIRVQDGSGFFLIISKNDINVDPAVAVIEGLYLTDGTFDDGTNNPGVTNPITNPDIKLLVRGSVVAYTGINLNRDLGNNSVSADLFEYAPDQIMLFPSKLGLRKINWKEVAP